MTVFRELSTEEAERLLVKFRQDFPEEENDPEEYDLTEKCGMQFAAEKDGEVIAIADIFAVDEHQYCSMMFLLRDPENDNELAQLDSDFTYYSATHKLLKRLRTQYDAMHEPVA